ncbi:MAG: extracellular solute-binding protein [Clostridia bacterium]|nr:extracellular solute-binding protein [Clostridia bacterium]
MRKKAALVCALLMCLTVLTACHHQVDRASFTIPESFDESTPVEIVFWAKNDTNQTQTDIYKQAMADFEALYPNVKVTMRLYTDYNQIYRDVLTNISTDTTPNVCITYPDHIATYLTGNNVVVPLDDLMEDPLYGLGGSELRFDGPSREEIVPEFLAEGIIGGQQYALPYMRSTEAVYLNQDFVEALGYEVPEILTWDFVWEVSEKAMAKDEEGNFLLNGQKTLIPFIYKSTDNMMISMLRQLDAGYSTEAGEVLIFNDTTTALLEEVYAHARSRAFSTFGISSYPGNFLNAGQCVFAIDSTAGATWMGSDAPLLDIHKEQVVPFTTAVRMIPQFDPENPKMISQGPSVCIFSKDDTQQVLASWLFVQYLLTNEVQIAYSGTEGYLPVTLKAQESQEYRDYLARKGEDNREHYAVKIEASELLMRNMSNTFTTPVFNGSADLRQAAGQLIEESAKAARRKKEMNREFIETLYSDMTSLYHLDQIQVTREEGETAEDAGRTESDTPLPTESRVLLGAIAAIWIVIGIGRLTAAARKSREKN